MTTTTGIVLSRHLTLTANTVDRLIFVPAPGAIEIKNRGAADIFVTYSTMADPAVLGNDTLVVTVGQSLIVPLSGPNADQIALISSAATDYSATRTVAAVITVVPPVVPPAPPFVVPTLAPVPRLQAATLRVYLRDNMRRRVAEIDDYSSLKLTRRMNDVGAWSLILPAHSKVTGLVDEQSGIIIERNGVPIFSGPIGLIHRSFSETVDHLVLGGPDDMNGLAQRIAYPCKVLFTDSPYDVRTGSAETVIKGYVTANTVDFPYNTAWGRPVPGLIVAADRQRGTTVKGSARFDNLRELLFDLAIAGGDLAYSCMQGVPGYDPTAIVFDVSIPNDKRSTARFATEFGNLREYEYEITAPTANVAIAAGSGEGTARVFWGADNIDSWRLWGKYEGPLVDRRDTSDMLQLQQAAQDEVDKGASKRSLSFKASETESLRYGTGWDLTDKVAVTIDGLTIVDTIREINYEWSAGGAESIVPTIGQPGAEPANMPRIYGKHKQLAQRVGQLETRV